MKNPKLLMVVMFILSVSGFVSCLLLGDGSWSVLGPSPTSEIYNSSKTIDQICADIITHESDQDLERKMNSETIQKLEALSKNLGRTSAAIRARRNDNLLSFIFFLSAGVALIGVFRK